MVSDTLKQIRVLEATAYFCLVLFMRLSCTGRLAVYVCVFLNEK